MSLPPPDYRFELPTIHISVWDDPVVDLLGHDPRSPYVEQFWLPLLGPSTTFLMRHLAARLDDRAEGFELDVDATASALGLGTRSGVGSPFMRALARTGQFRLTQATGTGALAVRKRIPTLSAQQVARLRPALRDRHDAWEHQARQEPTIEERRTRARRLALSLLEIGETEEAAAIQLHRWKIHPAMAHEALRWAQIRRGERAAARPPRPTAPVATRPDPRALVPAGPPPPGVKPKIGASRPAPGARFDPFEPVETTGDAA